MIKETKPFESSHTAGKKSGFIVCMALTRFAKFIIFTLVVNPVLKTSNFTHGFVAGMREGSNFAKYN
jgi:hypothetical protein